MKIAYLVPVCLLLLISCVNRRESRHEEGPLQIKVAAYNVEYSTHGTAREIGEALKPFGFDVVAFSEAPGGRWTEEVAEVLGMDHVSVGRYSTAGHKDKYKTIASRTPLYGYEEILMADTLHTVTRAITIVDDKEIALYSVHFPFGWRDQEHIDETTGKIRAFVDYLENRHPDEIAIVMGDFNFIPSDPENPSMYHEMFKEIGLDVSWKDLGIDAGKLNTHNAFNPEDEGSGKVIDHIMYNPEIATAIDGGIIEMEKPLSDHKPVWALIELK
jgi:maltose 6'-phosphate phosphatase